MATTTTTATIDIPANSKLAQLMAMLPILREQAKAAEEQVKAVSDAIKQELRVGNPDADRINATAGEHRVTLTHQVRVGVDSKRLRTERPDIAEAYATQTDVWVLR